MEKLIKPVTLREVNDYIQKRETEITTLENALLKACEALALLKGCSHCSVGCSVDFDKVPDVKECGLNLMHYYLEKERE